MSSKRGARRRAQAQRQRRRNKHVTRTVRRMREALSNHKNEAWTVFPPRWENAYTTIGAQRAIEEYLKGPKNANLPVESD